MALNFRKFLEGLRIVPKAASTASEKGDLDVESGSGKLNYHNGSTASPVVTEDHASQGANRLKSKDLDDATIAIVDSTDTSKKILFNAGGTASTSTTITAAQTVSRVITLPDATDTLVGLATSDVLTNKTIDGDSNTLQDIGLGSLKTVLADANKVLRRDAAGVVVSDNSLPNSSAIVTIDASQTLTNKTLTTLKVDKSTPTNTAGSLALPSTAYALVSANINEIAAGSDGNILILTNTSASPITIKNEFGTAGAQIRTGTNGDLSLESEASLILVYNSTAPGYWYVAGGVGGASTFNMAASAGAIVAGDSVYIDNTGTVQLLDATNDSKVEFVGVCLDAGGSSVRVQVAGKVSIPSASISGGSFTIGKPVFASASSPGKYVQPANTNNGNWVIPVGIATAATEMVINGAGSSTAVKMQADVDPSILNNTAIIVNTVGSNTNVGIGHPVYLDSSVFAQLIDAGNDSKIEYVGVSLSSGAGGGSVQVQVSGVVTVPSASFTVGSAVYVNPSAIPGGSAASYYTQTIPTSAGQWIVQAGIAVAANKFIINGAGGATAVKITSETDQFVYAKVRSVSTTQSLTNGDSIVLGTAGAGGITLTLPAPTSGKIFNIKKVDAAPGSITISAPSGTIDGVASKTVTSQYDSLTITSDGTNFFII